MVHDLGQEGFRDAHAHYYEKLQTDSKKPLYAGYTTFTRLSAVLGLVNLKARFGWSDRSFTELLVLLKNILPDGNILPKSHYEAKKILCPVGMKYQNIHACPNDCILYRNEFAEMRNFPTCGVSCYKVNNDECSDGASITNSCPTKFVRQAVGTFEGWPTHLVIPISDEDSQKRLPISVKSIEMDNVVVAIDPLGELNESLNEGGMLFVDKHPNLRVRVVHGNMFTVAVILNEIPQGVKEAFLKGATSRLGRAIALYLCQKKVKVLAAVYNIGAISAAFLANIAKTDAKVSFNGNSYHLSAWSLSILPDCKSVVLNTAKINSASMISSFTTESLKEEVGSLDDSGSGWSWISEPIDISKAHSFSKFWLLEQINTTADRSVPQDI
ncbi:hypothetical protein JHK87_033816 [Glycine soja]|nr:hypothetical protein JHK87_033816 [Glycine soja]